MTGLFMNAILRYLHDLFCGCDLFDDEETP